MISSKSDFIHIFNDLIHVYSPGARAKNPLGTNFWCQQKALITSTICCKFQTNLFEFWFYAHFLMFFHMYIAPGQGQTTFCGQNFDVNRKALSLCPFVASLKKISLKSDFIHIYIAPGQRQTTPWGQNFYFNINLLSFWSFAVSLPLNDLLTVFPHKKSIRDQIWPCCKIGQGQPRVIIWTNYDGPRVPNAIYQAQGHWPFSSGEDFWRVFTIYGRDGQLGHVTQTPRTNFRSPIPLRLHWNLTLIGQAVLEKIFKNGGQQTMAILQAHQKAQVELKIK